MPEMSFVLMANTRGMAGGQAGHMHAIRAPGLPPNLAGIDREFCRARGKFVKNRCFSPVSGIVIAFRVPDRLAP